MHEHHSKHDHSREKDIVTGVVLGSIIAKASQNNNLNNSLNDMIEDNGCAATVAGFGCLFLFFAWPVGLGLLILAAVIGIISLVSDITSITFSWLQSLGKGKVVLAGLVAGCLLIFFLGKSGPPEKSSPPVQAASAENANSKTTPAPPVPALDTGDLDSTISSDTSVPETTPDAELTYGSAKGDQLPDPTLSKDASSALNNPLAPASPSITSVVEPIIGTHTLPPYPAASKNFREQGVTVLLVSISLYGSPTDCTVVGSSGSDRLDNVACQHVMERWRWAPPVLNGNPAFGETRIRITWILD